MNPALSVMLKRLVGAGLCCIALCAQANENTSDSTEAASAATVISTTATSTSTTASLTTGATSDQQLQAPSGVAVINQPAALASTSQQQPQSPQNTTAAPIGSGRHLVSVSVALLGIVLLIFAISWFLKRFGQGGFTQNQHIKILAVLPLGTRERIVLIDAAGQQLLLGLTASTINTLHVFNEPVVLSGKDDKPSDFSRKLMAILQQKSAPGSTSHNNNNDSAAR